MMQRMLIVTICFGLFIPKRTDAQLTNLIGAFGNELESMMCNGLRIGGDKCSNDKYGLQDFIDSFDSDVDSNVSDASGAAQSIIDRLDAKLNERASFLTNLSHIIRSECLTANDMDSLTPFSNLYFAGNAERAANLPSDMEYSDVYGTAISLTASTYKLANGVDTQNENIQRDARISQLLEPTMRSLYDDHCAGEYCNMYFGTNHGLLRQFPGVESRKESGIYVNSDPRFRNWYVGAATAPKDLIILLDISGSMRQSNRLTLAKEAVISVLNTLGSSSLVTVIAFSDELTLPCFDQEIGLVAATSRNIEELTTFVDGLVAQGLTDFTIAFNAAFDMLQDGAKHCQPAILFLTDGIADDVSELVQERNTLDIGAVVFSFTLGDEADTYIPQNVADITGGVYTHIDDGDENLITAMSSYYLYYAYGGSASDRETDDIILTTPYVDFDSNAVMITMALPVYINKTYFVGVVATDIALSVLSDAMGDITIGRKSYSFVINEESQVLLHPLLDSATAVYPGIFIDDVEPEAYGASVLDKMLNRESGAVRITASVIQSAGDAMYNGYIHKDEELLYVYAGVGPSSLSIAIVIYSELTVEAPNIPGFGLTSSPDVDCDTNIPYVRNSTDLSECVAPFILFHDLDLMEECSSDWLSTAQVLNGSDPTNADLRYNAFYQNKLYSVQYPVFYVPSGLFERPSDALHVDPSCESLSDLHTLTNRLGAYDSGNLPFGGFREEVAQNLIHSIYTLSSVHELWKPSFLANDSSFVSLWFGHYTGLHISYPGKRFSTSYNNVLRPWYRRATAYPSKMIWMPPYVHASTGKLVMTASTVIYAPNSEYVFGVAGFIFEYQAFWQFWMEEMGSVCDPSNNEHCFLIDSSGFCLYYEGIENDIDDADISRKFFGDFEPTLMQSLVDRGFFMNDTNVNFESDTVDITYSVDDGINASAFASTPTSFAYNNGQYTVHMVPKTNLWVIHIEMYMVTAVYPSNCPDNNVCADVTSPGCVLMTSGSECVSARVDVCIAPDAPSVVDESMQCSPVNKLGACVLTNGAKDDMCASSFMANMYNCDGDSATPDPSVFPTAEPSEHVQPSVFTSESQSMDEVNGDDASSIIILYNAYFILLSVLFGYF